MTIWPDVWRVLLVVALLVGLFTGLFKMLEDAGDLIIVVSWLAIFVISIAGVLWDEWHVRRKGDG